MTRRTICGLGVVVAALAAFTAVASAHRLDEYLQAARVNIDADRIGIEIDLTPGANIASQIVEQIDTDRNGWLSSDERHRYAQSVIAAIVLSLDGRVIPVALASEDFPTVDAMAAGTGTIRLRAAAAGPVTAGRHQLQYRAAPLTASSVYLVNALMPTDARIQLEAPQRDTIQQALTLDLSMGPDPSWLRAGWIVVAAAMFLVLGVARHRPAVAASTMLLAIGTTAGLAACGARTPSALAATPLDARFTLAPGEKTTISGTELVVTFDRVVEDSRCPAGVACIQAGDGVIAITVTEKGGTTASYQLHTAPNGTRSAVHGGVTITLEDLTPTPVASRATPPQDYRATLRANR
jgi:hypothetical protein